MFDTFIDGPDATRAAHGGEREQLRVVRARPGEAVHPRDERRQHRHRRHPGAHGGAGVHAERHPRRAELGQVPRRAGRLRRRRSVPTRRRRSAAAADPRLFRYQVQGPLARDLVESVFGGPLPPAKFFHSVPVVAGRHGVPRTAAQHGGAGRVTSSSGPGDYADGGEGHAAEAPARSSAWCTSERSPTPSASVESGWIPSPVPAIYTDPELAGLPRRGSRCSVSRGSGRWTGRFFSEDIEDYYCTPYELGYGTVDLVQPRLHRPRRAARGASETAPRAKVTLVFDPADVRAVLGRRTRATTSPTRGTGWRLRPRAWQA